MAILEASYHSLPYVKAKMVITFNWFLLPTLSAWDLIVSYDHLLFSIVCAFLFVISLAVFSYFHFHSSHCIYNRTLHISHCLSLLWAHLLYPTCCCELYPKVQFYTASCWRVSLSSHHCLLNKIRSFYILDHLPCGSNLLLKHYPNT